MKKKYFFIVFTLLFAASLSAQISDDLWSKSSMKEKKSFKKVGRETLPNEFEIYQLNLELLKEKLVGSPLRKTSVGKSNTIIGFPNEKGIIEKYFVYQASIMEEDLQNKYPAIRSYIGKGIDNPNSIIRFSITSLGLSALVLNNSGLTICIDPYTADRESYIIYSTKSLPEATPFDCGFDELKTNQKQSNLGINFKADADDGNLRTFRLAIATTGEYSQYHLTNQGISSGASDDVKKEAVLSAVVVVMTNVNALFERDVALTMVLVANNTDIIFLDPANDNLTDNDRSKLISESQSVIDNIIGSENYDIGHTFANGFGGGVASLDSSCITSRKARACSGGTSGYYLEITVAHEMGHQYGAGHTYNDCRGLELYISPSSSVEPGSGTTIMSYAGNCYSQNVQITKDDYFHLISIRQIWNNITNDNNQCATLTATENTAPTIDKIPDYTIPISTPFRLEANASDANGDNLTYTFEQLDSEIAIAPPISTATIGPSFRSLAPSSSPIRNFPNSATNVIGNLSNTWEVLPSVARTMKFGVTVRDNNIIVGQTVSEETTITFDANSNPFQVTSQSSPINWNIGTTQTISWDVSNTDKAPVSCSLVKILLSTDGGYTFPIELATDIANDGSHEIVVPDVSTGGGRIKVESVGNIFYAINQAFIIINFENKTFVPDANFEQTLINLGYDNVLDNTVLSNNIKNITLLDVSNKNIDLLIGIEDFTNLTSLQCYLNQLVEIDLSNNTALTTLECSNNQLTSLDVSNNTLLYQLHCSNNKLTSLDVSNNTALQNLSLNSNQISSLDLDQNIALEYLFCANNNLQSLDLTKNTALRGFSGYVNQFTSLDVSQNIDLEYIDCSQNQLSSLDVSQNTSLTGLSCNSNLLTSLDVRNGNNSKLSNFNASFNPSLTCIQVDNETEANTGTAVYKDWQKDDTASYSENCGYALGVDDEILADGLKLYPNPVSNSLTIDSQIPVERLEIYTVLGQKVIEKSSDLGSVSTETLSKGIYMLKILSEKGWTTRRFIKQ